MMKKTDEDMYKVDVMTQKSEDGMLRLYINDIDYIREKAKSQE